MKMFKQIEEMIVTEEKEYQRITKGHYKEMEALRKQTHCDHKWEYLPDTPFDSFCFATEMPQRLLCKKCGLELWNAKSTHPEDIKAIHHILIDMDITPLPPLETR